jgi:hypothetical protein
VFPIAIKFLVRFLGVAGAVIVIGLLIVIAVFVINRTIRYVVDWLRQENNQTVLWLQSFFSKPKKKKK